MNVHKKRDWLKQKLREISTSSAAGGYATPAAFNPKKGANGTARNYYLKQGYTLVNKQKLRKKAKGTKFVDLWQS